MLAWLFGQDFLPNAFNVVSYLSFRAVLSFLTAFILSLVFCPWLIQILKKQQIGQMVRDDGPESHFSKKGTPTMGGIILLFTVSITTLLWSDLANLYIWISLFVFLGFGVVGFYDDYLKVVAKNSKGLSAKKKYLYLSIISILAIIWIYSLGNDVVKMQLVVPFFKDFQPYLGLFFIPLAYFTIVGSGNAVNLTDGLDGLAITQTILVAIGLGVIAWLSGNVNFANYLHIPYLSLSGELMIFCAAIVGAGFGFLWFNSYPALIFMGDVGSLALGGALGVVAILVRQELLLVVMGGIFVIETLSVILQVGSFKLRKKRIFKMAPIHHHFELKGSPEPRVMIRFWIVAVILVVLSLVSLKLR